MLNYSSEQVASIIAIPIIVILLFWTVIIFHKNRNKWGPYDILIVSILTLSILRNLTILAYTLSIIFLYNDFNTDYCGSVTWTFNSLHTFEASCLTSVAVVGLFSAKLRRKGQSLRSFLTSTHIIYHLFCLATLCACVGVAAILAQKNDNIFADNFDFSPCNFLPFELDIKFNVFIIVLHMFLACISLLAFLGICYNCYKTKKNGFDYIKKSNSDLSELSNNFHGVNSNVNDNRNYYDTYTINRSDFCNNKDAWTNTHFNNSEVLSNNSTTVSSTNSRRPCIVKQQQEEEEDVEIIKTGLETMHPVLIVCYLFYHLPIIVLCIYPRLIYPWPVAGIALWLGLVQDLLIPIGLGIVDSRFCGWVTEVYRCTAAKHVNEKLPQVGLDGKFRPFGLSSQPQSLDLTHPHDRVKQVEHRFPITNGSLYTSIDGRLPVIHNYRRHKDFRTGTLKQHDLQSSNVALHSTHLSRRDIESTPPKKYASCSNCEVDQCPSHSDLHHLTPQYVHRKLSFLQASQNNVFSSNGGKSRANHQNCQFVANRRLQNTQNSLQRNQIRIETNRHKLHQKRLSQSQESINHLYHDKGDVFYHKSDMNISSPTFNLNVSLNDQMIKNSGNLLRLNKMRLSRSEDSLTNIQVDPIPPSQPTNQETQYSSDEEFYYNHDQKDYDSMSSSNSITTEANCDFEFFQTKDVNPDCNRVSSNPKGPDKPKHVSQTRITRSSSKRSLESFQAFIEETKSEDNISKVVILHRSNSYTTLEDRKRRHKGGAKAYLEDESFKSKKVKSAEYLTGSVNNLMYIEDVQNNNKRNFANVGSSMPDFKKVFISEYI